MRKMHMNLKRLLAVLLLLTISVAFTPQMVLEAFAAGNSEITLKLADESKTSYLEGEPINIIATGTNSSAWVGLYAKGDKKDPNNGGVVSFRWYYVADYDGDTVDITKNTFNKEHRGDIKPGDYELILFGDENYNKILKTIEIKVIENPNKPENEESTPADELSLTLVDPDKTTYKIGEPVNIKATGIADGAWVGLYAKGESKDPDNGGVVSYRWYYVAEHNGETIDITSADLDDNNRGALPEGTYEIILFGDAWYSNVITTIEFNLEGIIDIDESQFSLETDKTDYQYGEPIKVKAEGTGINEGAWVGLYYADSKVYDGSFMYYFYVKDYEGVFTTIQQRTAGSAAETIVPQGKYELVLFADNGYALPVKKVPVTVTRDALVNKVLRDPGCLTFGLEYVVYEDQSSEYREIPTLGGHLWSVPVQIGATAQHAYYCERNELHKPRVEECTLVNKQRLAAATTTTDGKIQYTCEVCNGIYTEAIPKLSKAPQLQTSKFTYTGKAIKPALQKVTDRQGNEVPKGNYTVTYPESCTKAGKYKVNVKFNGNYSGNYDLSYEITAKKAPSPKLQTVKFVYTGKNIKPSLQTVKDSDGNEIPKANYTVTYPSKCKDYGTYQVKVAFKGNYSGTYNLSYEIFPKLKKAPNLKTTKFVYNGKNRKPALQTLYSSDGKVLPKKYYTVTYPKSCKNVGTFKAIVTFKGKTSKKYTLTYKIVPKSVSLNKVTKGTKSFKVTWKKATAQTTGYQIAYSKYKNFKTVGYKKVKGMKSTSTTVKKLAAKKTYFVKVRTYKTVGNKTYYSAWSKMKSVKTK